MLETCPLCSKLMVGGDQSDRGQATFPTSCFKIQKNGQNPETITSKVQVAVLGENL